MTEVEIETSQNEVNEESDVGEVEENVSEKVEEITVPATKKKSGKISKKQQRLNAIEDFKNGIENSDFKVYSLKNGSYRVVKRETPPAKIENNVESKPEIMPVINQQYTNEQYLINHILELEKKFEKLRLKQKKLKKSHKKIKADIYDDSEPIDIETVSREVDNTSEEIIDEEPKIVEKPIVEPQPVRYNKSRKLSWRQMLNQ
jgi:hypothetical protein